MFGRSRQKAIKLLNILAKGEKTNSLFYFKKDLKRVKKNGNLMTENAGAVLF